MKGLSQAMSIFILLLITTNLQAQQRTESSTLPNPPLDGIYKKQNIENRKTLAFDHVREADVFWEKTVWRVIDVREKMNKHFVYPKMPLAQVIFDAVQEGNMIAYDASDDQFSQPLTKKQCFQALNQIDTIPIHDVDDFSIDWRIVRTEMNWEDIKRFRIKEVWYFDEEIGTMKVRITGIAPLREVYDDNTGDFRFETPLFWIYYPDARTTLATKQVFNPINDANPMSWEDMLEMRYFSSYIYKKSNIYDRRIKEYKSGIAQLFESKRISDEIFNVEQDIWSK